MQSPLPAGCRFIALQSHGDERGQLVAIEQSRDLPFGIRRAYYVFGMDPGVRRGLHAHRTLNQFAVAVSGSCKILLGDGTLQETVVLDDPAMGLILPSMVWHEMFDFSPDCVLLVLAEAPYDEADYIRDYDDFRTAVGRTSE